MPREWYRSVPVSGVVCLLVVGLWLWRSEAASGLERFWVGLMAVATGFGLWGLARAIQTRGWVGDEQHRNPGLDYAAAVSVAQTHVITHACLLITTVALLSFGLVSALTAPAYPGRAPTRGAYVLTAVFLLIGVVKTFLNVYLVIRRDRLIRVVQEIGAD